jgi:hypothetical protein
VMSALTQGFGIKQTALPCVFYVTLGMLYLSEIWNGESHLHYRAMVNMK